MSATRHRCPECHKSDELWRGVSISGWQSVDATLQIATGDHGVDDDGWHFADPTGDFGCVCGWEGTQSGLERLGIDGEPLPVLIPGQLEIAA